MKDIEVKHKSPTRAEMLLFLAKEQGVTRLKIPVYLNEDFCETNLITLELNQRAFNCLRRQGIVNVEGLLDKLQNEGGLENIRGLGVKTAREIVLKLYLFQYAILSPEKQNIFLKRVMDLNNLK